MAFFPFTFRLFHLNYRHSLASYYWPIILRLKRGKTMAFVFLRIGWKCSALFSILTRSEVMENNKSTDFQQWESLQTISRCSRGLMTLLLGTLKKLENKEWNPEHQSSLNFLVVVFFRGWMTYPSIQLTKYLRGQKFPHTQTILKK